MTIDDIKTMGIVFAGLFIYHVFVGRRGLNKLRSSLDQKAGIIYVNLKIRDVYSVLKEDMKVNIDNINLKLFGKKTKKGKE